MTRSLDTAFARGRAPACSRPPRSKTAGRKLGDSPGGERRARLRNTALTAPVFDAFLRIEEVPFVSEFSPWSEENNPSVQTRIVLPECWHSCKKRPTKINT